MQSYQSSANEKPATRALDQSKASVHPCLLVLQAHLHQVEGEDDGDANDARNPPIDHLGHEA